MGINLNQAPDHLVAKLSKADRPTRWISGVDAQEKYLAGQERQLQSDIDNFLHHVRPPVHVSGDPFGCKTKLRRGDKGRADRTICYRGRWLSIEAKAGNRKQDSDQKRNQASVEAAGGRYIVARCLQDVQQVLRQIDADCQI